jgi:hypothetical protein
VALLDQFHPELHPHVTATNNQHAHERIIRPRRTKRKRQPLLDRPLPESRITANLSRGQVHFACRLRPLRRSAGTASDQASLGFRASGFGLKVCAHQPAGRYGSPASEQPVDTQAKPIGKTYPLTLKPTSDTIRSRRVRQELVPPRPCNACNQAASQKAYSHLPQLETTLYENT